MAFVANSKAAFKDHLADLEVSELETAFSMIGIVTYGDLGFAVSDVQSAEKIEEELTKPVCGAKKDFCRKGSSALCARVHGGHR